MPSLLRSDRFAAGFLLAMFLLAANPAAAVVLSLSPSSQTAATGDMVSVDLVIDGLGDFVPDSLGDFDVDIAYDPTALTFTGYGLGGFLGDLGLGEAIDFSLGDLGGGIVNLAEVSLLETDAASCVFCIPPFLDDIQPGSFLLATLDFLVADLVLGASTNVSIDAVLAVGDGFGAPLIVDAIDDAVIRGEGVAAVPAPTALLLMFPGLVFLSIKRATAKASFKRPDNPPAPGGVFSPGH